MTKNSVLATIGCICSSGLQVQSPSDFKAIAYYSAGPDQVDGLPAKKLTHIIFSFCHLKANKLAVDNAWDTTTIRKLVFVHAFAIALGLSFVLYILNIT